MVRKRINPGATVVTDFVGTEAILLIDGVPFLLKALNLYSWSIETIE